MEIFKNIARNQRFLVQDQIKSVLEYLNLELYFVPVGRIFRAFFLANILFVKIVLSQNIYEIDVFCHLFALILDRKVVLRITKVELNRKLIIFRKWAICVRIFDEIHLEIQTVDVLFVVDLESEGNLQFLSLT
jgi:hypothetical protein